jgi:hypothetical protein
MLASLQDASLFGCLPGVSLRLTPGFGNGTRLRPDTGVKRIEILASMRCGKPAEDRAGLQPSGGWGQITQAVGLGWYGGAPLALGACPDQRPGESGTPLVRRSNVWRKAKRTRPVGKGQGPGSIPAWGIAPGIAKQRPQRAESSTHSWMVPSAFAPRDPSCGAVSSL